MHHVVSVESSYNPYAIGVVGGRLQRQPKTLSEALATVRMLESRGYNFSLGLAQVNRYNLAKYGLTSYEHAFQTCANLQAGSRILAECHGRSGRDWGKSFSCYYSGNFTTGFRHGYVQKIYASMQRAVPTRLDAVPGAIAVTSKPNRRAVEVTRYPVQTVAEVDQSAAPGVAIPPAMGAPASAGAVATVASPSSVDDVVKVAPVSAASSSNSNQADSAFVF